MKDNPCFSACVTRSRDISPGAFFALLLVSMAGLDFLTAPVQAANTCGPSGYWTVIIAFGLAVPLIYLANAMQRRFPGKNLLVLAGKALGQPLALAGNLLYLSVFMLWLIASCRNTAELVFTYLLDATPLWVVLLFGLLSAGYVAINGLTAVSRLASFVLIPAVTLRFLLNLLSLPEVEITHLLPAFSASIPDYLRGGIFMFNWFFPLTTIFVIYPLLGRGEKMKSTAIWATGVTALILSLGVIGTIGSFGVKMTGQLSWPNMAAVQHINIPYLILNQAGLLFLIVWLTMSFVGGTFLLYITASGLRQQLPVLDYRYTVLGLLIAIFGAVIMIPNQAVFFSFFTFLERWSIIPAALYPLLVYIIALIRGKSEKVG